MSLDKELKKEGYKFDNEYWDGDDKTEVWINKKEKKAIKIEWINIDGVV